MSDKRYTKFKYPRTCAKSTLRKCAQLCLKKDVACPVENSDCRYWIDYKTDNNCSFCAIYKNNSDGLTLRETADRLGLSFVRIKQIEDASLKKLQSRDPELVDYLLKDDF
tara:strand:+ start:83 stop:412 length:330 start_codon:yes stop_codon:yes gene_type:complete